LRKTVRSIVDSLILPVACACLALATPADAMQERSVRAAPAVIESGTAVSIPGHPIRIPLSPPPDFPFADSIWIPSPVPVRLLTPFLDGGTIEPVSEILGFVANPSVGPETQSWLRPPADWRVVRPGELGSDPGGPVYWMLFVRLPEEFDNPEWRMPDAGRQRAVTLQIGDERFPLRLAPPPGELPVGRIPPLEGETARWLELGQRLAPAAMDPTRRWRVSLLLDRIPAVRLFRSESLDEAFPLADPVLRGLSESLEAEWRSALSELAQTDPEMAAQLLTRQTLIVRQPDGALLPAWPTDGQAETELLPTLQSRRLSETERADAVRRYLDSRPNIRATVHDDGGQRLQTERTLRFRDQGEVAEVVLTSVDALVLITNLSPTQSSPTIGPPGQFDSTILRLNPFTSQRTVFSPSLARSAEAAVSERQQPVTGSLLVRDSRRESRVEFRVAPGLVRRPGQQIGPALEPWNLAAWNSDAVRASPADRQTALLLFRDDREARWKMLIEARIRPGQPDGADSVTVFFGPYGASDARIEVARDDSRTVEASDRWSAIVAIPEEVVARASRDGTLAIGFIRRGPNGSISSWPRPLMPDQAEPGRVRLDLTGWEAN
jgi:hypothetical protein